MPSESDKLLILDLDETLIYASSEPLVNRVPDFVGPYSVYKRPHLDKFLSTCLRWFDVGIWTTASRSYAEWVLGEMLPDPTVLAFVWTFDRCTRKFDYEQGLEVEIKRLKKLKRMRFGTRRYSLGSMIAIDDTPSTFRENYGNGIRVASYAGAINDDELPLLLKFLGTLRYLPDVRKVEKRGWRSRVNRSN